MAQISSPGLGSGLDVPSLVQQLVSAERSSSESRLYREESRASTELSALAKIKSALSALQSKLDDFDDRLSPRRVSVGDEELLAVNADDGAITGEYDIEIAALASAHRLTSKAFADQAVIGSGSLVVASGEKEITLEFAEGATLEQIRDAINAHDDNPGVRATIIRGADGDHLVLSAEESGSAHALRVSASGGDGGLDALAHDPAQGISGNYTEVAAARDANVIIDGVSVTSPGNRIEDVLEGVTLDLKAAKPGETVSVRIDNDSAALEKTLEEFITAYNGVVTTIASTTRFDAASGSSAPLTGDAMTRGIQSALRTILSAPTEGAPALADTLAELGITTQSDGKLKLDRSVLGKALDEVPDAALRLFSGENGLVKRLETTLKDYLDSSEGMLATREESLKNRIKRVESQREQLDVRMERLHQTYLKQFTALDTLLVEMQGTSSYLAQQLANL